MAAVGDFGIDRDFDETEEHFENDNELFYELVDGKLDYIQDFIGKIAEQLEQFFIAALFRIYGFSIVRNVVLYMVRDYLNRITQRFTAGGTAQDNGGAFEGVVVHNPRPTTSGTVGGSVDGRVTPDYQQRYTYDQRTRILTRTQ